MWLKELTLILQDILYYIVFFKLCSNPFFPSSFNSMPHLAFDGEAVVTSGELK